MDLNHSWRTANSRSTVYKSKIMKKTKNTQQFKDSILFSPFGYSLNKAKEEGITYEKMGIFAWKKEDKTQLTKFSYLLMLIALIAGYFIWKKLS